MKYASAALLAFLAAPAQSDTLTHLGSFDWVTPSVVGLSGLEVSDDGQTFTAISDRGWVVTGGFVRSEKGITDLDGTKLQPLLGNDGNPVAARRVGDWSDAEGLAISSAGTWVSFERWAHVSAYDTITQTGRYVPDHPDFATFADNRQLEALAVHPDGTVFTMPEDAIAGAFPLYRLQDRTWQVVGQLSESGGFSVVGADFDPAGRLYILERKHLLGRFLQSRVRRLDVTDPAQAETLWTSARGAFGNLEGIAFWADDQGPRLTMVSDNNGDADIPTQFVDFRVTP